MVNYSIKYTLIILFSCTILHPMQKPYRWRGRVIPMAYNKNTNTWSLLLSHKMRDPQNLFTDFAQESNPGEKANHVAAQALKEQTKGVYSITISGVPYKQNKTGDWFHFVPVNYISSRDLYNIARNNIKDDFIWVSSADILNHRPIIHSRRGKIMLSNAVQEILRKYLPTVINELDKKNNANVIPQQVSINPATSCGKNWLARPNAILFYQSNQPYFEFTNFYRAPIKLDGKVWPTTEHYFQAQKFTDPVLQEKIRNQPTARDAFNEGRNSAHPKRPDWDTIKITAMEKAVRAKFDQHQDLKNLLTSTDSKILVENAGKNDAFWGAGADGNGENYLGRILMHVRDELSGKITAGTPFKP